MISLDKASSSKLWLVLEATNFFEFAYLITFGKINKNSKLVYLKNKFSVATDAFSMGKEMIS